MCHPVNDADQETDSVFPLIPPKKKVLEEGAKKKPLLMVFIFFSFANHIKKQFRRPE